MNNNMKKYFILAAAAIVAMAACSKMENDYTSVPDKKISFEVASYLAQTKAAGDGLLRGAGDTPAHSKTLLDNNDGTHKLSLTVTGLLLRRRFSKHMIQSFRMPHRPIRELKTELYI